MKRREVLEINRTLNNLSTIKDKRLGYAVARNKRKIRSIVGAIDDISQPSEGYRNYEMEKHAVAMKFVERDATNCPIDHGGGRFKLDQSKIEEFESEMAAVDEKWKEVISERAEQMDGVDTVLDEELENELSFHRISVAKLPDDFSAEQIESIWFMLDDK